MCLRLRRLACAPRSLALVGAILSSLILNIASFNSVARATTIIQFDPDGAGPDAQVPLAAIDFKQGNSLFQGIGPVINGGPTPVNVGMTNYIQSSVNGLDDANGNLLAAPGLGHSYQLTMVMGFSSNATMFPGGIDSYALAAGPVNFFRLYFNPGLVASDLAGTGFATPNPPGPGHLILSGTLTSATGVFSASPGGGPLDQFGPNNYPGITTLSSVGGGTYDVAVTGADPTFFVNPPPVNLQFVLANASNIDPFLQADPSALFYNGLNTFAANIGAVNGLGADFQTQADANASFEAVPEPSSLVLAGMGLVAITAYLRRRSEV